MDAIDSYFGDAVKGHRWPVQAMSPPKWIHKGFGIRKGIPAILVRTVLGFNYVVVFCSGEAQDVE